MPEPQRGVAYEFTLTLIGAATGQIMPNPPLSAGDFTVSKDHGALTALATLPAVAHDPDGVWEDVVVQIQPTRTLGTDFKVLLSSDTQPGLTLAVGAITAAQLALDACQKLADVLARRHTSAIEASANGETLDVNSLYGVLAMSTGHKRDTTTHADRLTVYQSNGTTELAQVPIVVDAAAEPIVEVGG
jgi:hypothetical protein